MKRLLLLFILLTPLLLIAQYRSGGSLNGSWRFAIDPVKVGEQEKWFHTSFSLAPLDIATVPHSFSADPRYFFYTGTAWYFKKFNYRQVAGCRTFLKFGAVFYKAKIWVNGQLAGAHEGGYTPFEIDITPYLREKNTLAVQVNNEWDTTTIPGAKTSVAFTSANNRQFVPWINYGGITRPVQLAMRPELFIAHTKIKATPDLRKKNAAIRIQVFIKNNAAKPYKTIADAALSYKGITSKLKFRTASVSLEPGEEKMVELTGTMTADEVRLWDQDHPNLYAAKVFTRQDTVDTRFGIREIKVKGTQLLLNGAPVKMGGANRPLDYPGLGSVETEALLEKDMQLLKSGGMELSRISHYPVSTALLDWADANGLLLIAEAGNWQLTPQQMADTSMRRKFQSQMQEMITSDWNHPSIIAYSLGNEFQSQTEEGKAWTRDMRRFVKTMDSTRLITFASMIVFRDEVKKPEDEASQYTDFISANMYGNYEKQIQHIHALYPDKPLFISEFGLRADAVKSEEDRNAYLREAIGIFRKYDFIIGASVWTFNDYLSRYSGTAANGYRPWGLVSPDRTPRGAYYAIQEEFSPATVKLQKKPDGSSILTITARQDFPAYKLEGYVISCNQQTYPLHTLNPGESQSIAIALPSGEAAVELIKPGGFVLIKQVFK